MQNISSGGSAVRSLISSGGQVHIYNGGIEEDARYVGGEQHLHSGVNLSNTSFNGGGQHISSGATALNTSLNSGAQQIISNGGSVNGTIVNNASVSVSQGGRADSSVVNAGGKLYVSNGGSSYNTIINTGGHEYILSGGYGPYATINSGGQQTISAGGLDEGSTINNGGVQHIYGQAKNIKIQAGGLQNIYSGGSAISGRLDTQGRIDVMGGTLTSTLISGGSSIINVNGGTLDSITITNGAGGGSIINIHNASIKGLLQDNAGANTLNISSSTLSAANVASDGVVGITGWQNLNLNPGTRMTLAGDLTLATTSQLMLASAYLNQSINTVTLSTSQLTNAGTISILAGQTLNLIGNYTQTSSGILELGLGDSIIVTPASSSGTTTGSSATPTVTPLATTPTLSSGRLNITGSATLQPGARIILNQSTPVLEAKSRYNNLFTASQGITGSFSEGVYRGRKFSLQTNSTGGIDLVTGDINASNDGFAKLNALLGGGQAQASLNQSQSSLNLIRERMERMQGSAYYGTDDNNQVWFSPSPYAHIGRNNGQGSVRDSAYEQKGGGIAFGIDKAITTERRIGAAVIINNSQIDGKDHSLKSSINNTGLDLAVYGHQSLQDDLTLSVIAKSGYTRAKASRIDDTELPVRAKSSQDIWHLNLAAELVKTIVKEQLTLSPVLGLEYGSAWVSGYQERGAGYYSLNTERQQAQSLIASVGIRVAFSLVTLFWRSKRE